MEKREALAQQQKEIDDYSLYKELARISEDLHNRQIFLQIAEQERRHYQFWKKITGVDLKPRLWRIRLLIFLAKILGISFIVKLLEREERKAQEFYRELASTYPEALEIYEDEKSHEEILISMLQDSTLAYAGAIVLGMNDALVELTGTLTGLALAFDNSRYVGITGIIMGVAASLSMAGSAYLEARERQGEGIDPKRYALYTGISYLITTALVVSPFFIVAQAKGALLLMFLNAALAIVAYNFYIAVARNEEFSSRVKEMFTITFGVSLISFLIGSLVNRIFGIEI
ncbi:MAG: rubrerythrin family protein [Epsilonproteobacteria bacterium]|nr:rubrerythrin family protein [Campylobacterota bacterium]NPA57566.1 rubrerythrin family protein [Campylobacterota bacterium]